jgi:hypothetical protein
MIVQAKSRILWLGLIAAAWGGCTPRQEVDFILHNARVVTLDEAGTVAEAIAVKDGRVVEVGAERQILNRYRAEEMYDAGRAVVYPGWMDGHAHLLGYALGLREVDLVGTGSWEEVVERVRAGATGSQGWLVGRGWDQNDWAVAAFPDRAQLDAAFPDRPVMLHRVDGHAVVANGAALAAAGITGASRFTGGEVQLRPDGTPSGTLIDAAAEALIAQMPPPDEATQREALREAEKRLRAVGLTAVVDAGLDWKDIRLIERMHADGELALRVVAMVKDSPENLAIAERDGPLITDRLVARAFKFYMDGALGSRGAALLEPYDDRPDWKGLMLQDEADFQAKLAQTHAAGFQAATHAIGDAAMDRVLRAYATQLGGSNDLRWRIEHAQVMGPSDVARMRELTVFPSVQPTHATSDAPWAGLRLGRNRLHRAYAYRDLQSVLGILTLGTDFPVESIDPRLTFYAATARRNAAGEPKDGFQLDQALSPRDALRGMTVGTALANFLEADLGSIEPGKWADFTVVDRDLLEVSPEEARDARILRTFIAGK